MELTPWYRNSKSWLLIGLLLVIAIVVFLLTRHPSTVSPTATCSGKIHCEMLTQITWTVDLKAKTLHRVTQKSSAQPFIVSESGNENVLLAVVDTAGRTVYSRKIFLNTLEYYDYVDGNGKEHGGAAQASSTILTSYIPADDITSGRTVKITLLSNGSLLAQGPV